MAHKEENITTKRSKRFTIILESNPTSGYRWFPIFDRSIISVISHDFRPSSNSRVGTSGRDIFTFKATNCGTTLLKMVYKRSWEQQFVMEKIFFIEVK
jgi:predicted secreted protein